MEFINLKAQYQSLKENIHHRMNQVLEHGAYIMGPEVHELEERLAQYVGVKHCISVSSGTEGLFMALLALGIKPGDEVITTPFTFIATAETISLLGAVPVFVDIDPITYHMDPLLLKEAITSKTRAIMPVSLYGQCADMDAINEIALEYGLPVIEDGAQSFGALYKNRLSCSLSTLGVTSFFPSKPLGCYGDGGAIFTNDDALSALLRQIRVHGQDRRYHHPIIGLNGRLDTLQAAILLAKLDVFPEEVLARKSIGARYSALLQGVVPTPVILEGNTSVYAQYTVEVEERNRVQEFLKGEGIPTAVHYPTPLHLQPAFSYLAQGPGSFPQAEKASARVMSLPMDPYLSLEAQDKIVEKLKLAISIKEEALAD